MDGKARTMIIVTPKRHVKHFEELPRNEFASLWKESFEWMLKQSPSLDNFKHIIMNIGMYMNHPHLHVKISFRKV